MQSTLEQARDQGPLGEDAEIDVIQGMLFGTVLYQLVASHQAPDARQIETSLWASARGKDRMCSVQGSSGSLCTSLLTRLRGPTRLMAW